jgi:hypothetical protein
MTFLKAIPRALLAFIAICIIQAIAGMLVPMKPFAAPPHFLLWTLLSNAVTVAALSFVAARADFRGWRLGVAIAALPLAIFSINLIEGVVFLTNSHVEWSKVFLMGLVSAALAVPVWAALFGRNKDAAPDHYHPIQAQSRSERAWKLAISAVAYVFLYFLAGSIIFPYVKDFYATQHLPSVGNIVALQFFVRGPLFILLCLALVRMLGLRRTSGAFAVGVIFTLLTGVAPLLIPNPYFPDTVRWVHFCEVTSSNFVFGTFVGWLWGSPQMARAQSQLQAA